MNRKITVTITKTDQEVLRRAANILRFCRNGTENENACFTPREIVNIANKEYKTDNEYFSIIYEE